MKNFILIAVMALTAGVGSTAFYNLGVDKNPVSDLALASVEALSKDETGASNYGPAVLVDCSGGILHKKICYVST